VPVHQRHPVGVHPPRELAHLRQLVLYLEDVGEVGPEQQRQLHLYRPGAVVGHLQLLLHAVPDMPVPDQ